MASIPNDLFRNFILKFMKGLNALGMAFLFVFSGCFFYHSRIVLGNLQIIGIVLLFLWTYYMFGKLYDAFLISVVEVSEAIISQVLSVLIADCMIYIITCIFANTIISPLGYLICLLGQVGWAFAWCFGFKYWYFHHYSPRKTIIIYEEREDLDTLIQTNGLSKEFLVMKNCFVDDCLNQLGILLDYEIIFLSGVRSEARNQILKYCIENHKVTYVLPRIGDIIMNGAARINLMHLPIVRVAHYNPPLTYLIVKRAFDIVISSIVLILFSPVLCVTAIAIKLEDKGPVFYKQERMTQHGRNFYIHKFRSMRVDAEKDGVARLSTGDQDPRITRVGRFIRKVRIDELPQLLDILKGDMSIVGPRPERESIARQYEQEIPEFRLRLQCKAGLTGLAQVYGKYNSTPYEKLQLDLMYIAHPSFLEDLRICFATIKVIFMPESTEGVADGEVTAMSSGKRRNNNGRQSFEKCPDKEDIINNMKE